ncbi:MAG: hypothetical protein DRO15_06660 [Thermoprotei archaeon]|nr:MAG: hypothetical protein DRO15_06660 [Thermoprotei archaeon]
MFRGLIEGFENLFAFTENYSRFHKIDPRIKLIYCISSILMALLINDMLSLTMLVMVNLILAILSKIPLRRYVSVLRSLAMFIAFIFTLNFILRALFEGLAFSTLADTTYSVIRVILRLILVALPLMLLINTTTPREVMQGLVSFGLNYKYLYAIILLMRYIPIVFNEMLSIYDAQRSRGIEIEKARIIERIKRLKSIVIPAFVCSLLRARDLLEALELRGFGYTDHRTFYEPLKIRKLDIAFITIVIVIYIVIASYGLIYDLII